MYERCSVFLDIDIIDHLTKACRDGKGFDKKKAVDIIRSYYELYDSLQTVKLPVDSVKVTIDEDEGKLYESLIIIRDHLIAGVL